MRVNCLVGQGGRGLYICICGFSVCCLRCTGRTPVSSGEAGPRRPDWWRLVRGKASSSRRAPKLSLAFGESAGCQVH